MALRLIATIVLLWLGVRLVRWRTNRSEDRNPTRRRLGVVVLTLMLGVPGILLVLFAIRSGNAALMLVVVAFASVLVLSVLSSTRRSIASARRRHRPPLD
jgi:drug/metabolite transporter (DMT)-like permease